MKFEEFKQLSARTDANLGSKNEIHWLLGSYNEFGEAVSPIKKALVKGVDCDTHKLGDELGDVLWYLAKGARLNNIVVDEHYAYVMASDIIEMIQKFNYYWEKKDVIGMFCVVIDMCNAYDLDIEKIMQTNIDKLMARHPNGFDINNKKHTEDEQRAINGNSGNT